MSHRSPSNLSIQFFLLMYFAEASKGSQLCCREVFWFVSAYWLYKRSFFLISFEIVTSYVREVPHCADYTTEVISLPIFIHFLSLQLKLTNLDLSLIVLVLLVSGSYLQKLLSFSFLLLPFLSSTDSTAVIPSVKTEFFVHTFASNFTLANSGGLHLLHFPPTNLWVAL